MPANGNSCDKDPITGYLTPTQSGAITVFGSESKKRFIQEFEQSGDLSKTCDLVGVSLSTLRDHLTFDEAFTRDLHITTARMEHHLTGMLYKKAEKGDFMSAMAWLRAHSPAKWNPKQQIVIASDDSSLADLFTKVPDSVIDVPEIK